MLKNPESVAWMPGDEESKRVAEYQRLMEPLAAALAQRVWRVLQNRDDVLDVLQDVQLRIWQKLTVIQVHPNPAALVVKIGIERALDVRRERRNRASQSEQDLSQRLDESASVEGMTELSEAHEEVLDAIARLPNQQSVCVYLRLVEQQHYSEISRTLEITEATVRKHVERGRRQLQLWLPHLMTTNEVKQ